MKLKKIRISLLLLSLMAGMAAPVAAMAKTYDVYKAVIVEEQERNQPQEKSSQTKSKKIKKTKKTSKKKVVTKSLRNLKRGEDTSDDEVTPEPEAKETKEPAKGSGQDPEAVETYLADLRAISLIQMCCTGTSAGILLYMSFAKGMER